MHAFELFAHTVFVMLGVCALAALLWTLAAAGVLMTRPLGSRLPVWVSWHPMQVVYNPKTDEHVHKPRLAQVAVACFACLFAAPVLMALGLLWLSARWRLRKAAQTVRS